MSFSCNIELFFSWPEGSCRQTAVKCSCSCYRICCVFRALSSDYAESKQINLVPCQFECLVFPLLCHLLSVTEVHVIFIFSQSDCILCMSAVPVLHKGYSLVLLFVVCLDSFVSCCNSCAADNTERLTGVTKLCCS